MSETPNNKPTAARPPAKPKPRAPASATGQSGGQNSAQNRNAQGANQRRRPPQQKARRPQNQGRPQRNSDDIGNSVGNRRPPNRNNSQPNGNGNRSQGQGQNRNGNQSNYRTADPFGDDQFRGSDWYREDQARFAKRQIAIERAEASGQSEGTASSGSNQNQRNPRNRNNRRPPRPAQQSNSDTQSNAENGEANSAADDQKAAAVKPVKAVAENNTPTAPAPADDTAPVETKPDTGKRDNEKSRRAPWRTQKHATARKTPKADAPPKDAP